MTVLVVGSQLTDETADAFVDSEGDGRIVPDSQVNEAFSASNPKAQGYSGDAALGDMLGSSGQGADDYNVDGGGFGRGRL